jgi:tripartite-type tricarboxylate transporter receptor subunit TctC
MILSMISHHFNKETSMFKHFGRFFGALALVCSGATSAWSDTYPSKPITLVVTQGPGSGSDVTGRLLAGYLGPILGQNVVVENRVGASGIIGHQSVVRAAPDGYTLLFTSTAGLFVVPVMNANAKYSLSDFVPVAPVMRAPFAVLVANTPTAPKNMAELLQAVRSKPQSYASAGIGTMTHLGSELVLRKAGVQATHVPYKGSGAALTDLMGGQVLFATDSLTASMALIRSGKLRALATTGPKRLAILPDVPSTSEFASGLEAVNWYGMVVPAGTPREAIARLNREITKVLEMPDIKEKLVSQGIDPAANSPEEFGEFMKSEAAKWARVIRAANIKPDS